MLEDCTPTVTSTPTLLVVFNEHWTSTLARLDTRGEPEPTRVAPRFYGLTAERARRRMIQALENDYDEVVTAPER